MPKFIVERHVAMVAEIEADTLAHAIDLAEEMPSSDFVDAGIFKESIIAEEDIGKREPILTYTQED